MGNKVGHIAAFLNDWEVIELLAENGINVYDIKNKVMNSHNAIEKRNPIRPCHSFQSRSGSVFLARSD